MHKGPKLKCPLRSYNITTNHRRRLLCATKGHSVHLNDKTLLLYNTFLCSLQKGEILKDLEFNLFEYDSKGQIVERKYRGAWVIADNGYLKWATIIPPYKITTTYAQTRWSEWMESMRKDVECTFGILKGRFRILKAGIRLHSIEKVDQV